MVGGAELRSTAEKPKELPWKDTSGFPKDTLWIPAAIHGYPERARNVFKITKTRPREEIFNGYILYIFVWFIFS